jgi:hypothetical protein
MTHSPEQIRAARQRQKAIMAAFEAEAQRLQMQNPRWPYSKAYEQALTQKSSLYEESLDLQSIINGRRR